MVKATAPSAPTTERLLPSVYEELRSIAGRLLRSECRCHALEATALVHEAYLRLVTGRVDWQDRTHFLAAAALAMRRILINHARKRRAAKRGGGWRRVGLSDCHVTTAGCLSRVDRLAVGEALRRLEALDQRCCRGVELRFFAGLSVEQAARVLGVSPRLVELDWQMARAWLHAHLVR